MRLTESLRAVIDMFRMHRLRAMVVVLCTATGVSFLVGMVSIVEGMSAYIEHDLLGKVYGFNTVRLRPQSDGALAWLEGRPSEQRRVPISFADFEWLSAQIDVPGVMALSYTGRARVGLRSGGHTTNERVIGATAGLFAVQSLDLQVGRPFTEHEDAAGAAVAVVGADVANRLFGEKNGIGAMLHLDGMPYRVIGVLERRGTLFGFSMDRLVVVPARSAVNGVINGYNEADAVYLRVDGSKLLPEAEAEVEGAMRLRHRLAPSQPNDFDVGTSAGVVDAWRHVERMLLMAGPTLTGVALLVAILVTMNIMLVVVTERVPEIGLRKALGARRRDVLTQFLSESVTLSGLGGLIGVIFGHLLAGLVVALSPLPARVAPWSVVFGLAIGTGVGLLAGVYPAYRAAQLSPIMALGRE